MGAYFLHLIIMNDEQYFNWPSDTRFDISMDLEIQKYSWEFLKYLLISYKHTKECVTQQVSCNIWDKNFVIYCGGEILQMSYSDNDMKNMKFKVT